MRGAFSVVIDGGYSLGIACRIDPSLQAIGNFDSAELPVNSGGRFLCPHPPKVCHTLCNYLNQIEESCLYKWHDKHRLTYRRGRYGRNFDKANAE